MMGRDIPIKELLPDKTGKTNIKKEAHSTVSWDEGVNGEIVHYLKHHQTIILERHKDHIVLNSGGWRSITTKKRLNDYLPSNFGIYQEKGQWYVCIDGEEEHFMFYDGIKFSYEGKLLTEKRDPDWAKIKKINKMIKSYCDGMKKLEKLPEPSSGDCWYCCMNTKEGNTLGEALKNNDHLYQHVKDHYYHGSLFVNAMRYKGYQNRQIGVIFHMFRDRVVDCVRSYLRNKLLPDVATR